MKTIGRNIKELDNQIGDLLSQYNETEDDVKRTVIMDEIRDLTEIRETLKSSKVEGSNSALWLSGGLSMASILLIMAYEKENVISSSKAFNIATRIFRN